MYSDGLPWFLGPHDISLRWSLAPRAGDSDEAEPDDGKERRRVSYRSPADQRNGSQDDKHQKTSGYDERRRRTFPGSV
jgi:hypothetical protein